MLPKKHRATTEQVKKTIHKGITKHSENFSVRILKKESPTTIAVVVSKKVAAKAVVRNKLKRRIKSILRGMKFPENKTLVIYIKKGVQKLSLLDSKKELQKVLNDN